LQQKRVGYGTRQFVLNPAKILGFIGVLLLELFYLYYKND
jgi:hypothetical protein